MHALLLALWSYAHASGLVETGDIEIGTSATEAVDAARAALNAGRWDEAAAAWEAIAEAGGGTGARVAQAVALYEAGAMRPARAAAEKALAKDPRNVAALNVLGLALVDSGSVEAGIERLEAARALASGAWKARVLVNLALAHYDRGDATRASAALAEAEPLAPADAGVAAALAEAKATVAGLSGKDVGVGPLLGKGDLRGARASADRLVATARTRRETVAAAIQLAAVERAEGSLDAAARRLEGAVKDARESGLTREAAIALANLGLVQGLAGRLPLAADALRASSLAARDGGYRVVEVDSRCELGLVLVRSGEVAGAEAEQRAAGALLGGMDYPQGVARQAELGGQIAAAKGDLTTAEGALSRAVAYSEGLGRFLDAARSATALASAYEGRDAARADTWSKRAEALFAKAGDPLGPAHVSMARAMSAARARRLDAALAGFARTAELAEKQSGERARTVARVARENAAQTLVMLGQGQDVAQLAAKSGVTDLVARASSLEAAFKDYDAGLAAYGSQQYPQARDAFTRARTAFEKLSEPAYAMRARRAAAWSVYNTLVALPTAQAYPSWQQLVDETARLDEPELFLRTYAAAALAAHALAQGDPSARLAECARMAEKQGARDLAARCHGAMAERPGDLTVRAKHARDAFAFDPDERASVYALYVVAVDAYNADNNTLAVELATLARPKAGQLASGIDEVLSAARGE